MPKYMIRNFIFVPAVIFVHIQRELLGITYVDLDARGRLLTICSAFGKYWRKNGNTMKQCISSL